MPSEFFLTVAPNEEPLFESIGFKGRPAAVRAVAILTEAAPDLRVRVTERVVHDYDRTEDILTDLRAALNAYAECTEDNDHTGAAVAVADVCVASIAEREDLLRLQRMQRNGEEVPTRFLTARDDIARKYLARAKAMINALEWEE